MIFTFCRVSLLLLLKVGDEEQEMLKVSLNALQPANWPSHTQLQYLTTK